MLDCFLTPSGHDHASRSVTPYIIMFAYVYVHDNILPPVVNSSLRSVAIIIDVYQKKKSDRIPNRISM